MGIIPYKFLRRKREVGFVINLLDDTHFLPCCHWQPSKFVLPSGCSCFFRVVYYRHRRYAPMAVNHCICIICSCPLKLDSAPKQLSPVLKYMRKWCKGGGQRWREQSGDKRTFWAYSLLPLSSPGVSSKSIYVIGRLYIILYKYSI